jgi:nicotinate-nucleotide adenylyltransferase
LSSIAPSPTIGLSVGSSIGSLVGLLGGSFNPPHAAHRALAMAAQVQLNLDRVDLLPAGQPWQKNDALMPSAAHRLAMCRLLVADYPNLGVEPCETQREGNTYTVDTLTNLQAAHPTNRYVLIIGADQATKFDSWRDWQGVLQRCTLAVAARNGETAQLPSAVQAFMALHGMVPMQVSLPAMAVSATDIRARLARGESCAPALLPAVARYISEHSLYTHSKN